MEPNNFESDIRYVKGLVKKAECASFPVSIYYLWSILVLAGFAMVDFAPEWVALYWVIAGPGGGILSGIIGSRTGSRKGQLDREIGIKHALHWSGMLVVIFLAVLLAIKGLIQGQLISQVILLPVALGWWTAGVHFDRRFLWLAAVMMLGFIGTLFIPRYVWTATGVLMAAVLVGFALFKEKKNA